MTYTTMGLIAGAVVLVLIVVAVIVAMKQKPQPSEPVPFVSPQPQPQAPVPAPAVAPEYKPAPLPATAAPEPAVARPATLQVEALAPSETGMAPMLGEPMLEPAMDEMKMGTDELPRVATGQVPMLNEPAGKARYRTAAAQTLADAIESMTCPKCSAPTFVGKETPEEVGADGSGMFKLEARCGACGHKANLIDMRVG